MTNVAVVGLGWWGNIISGLIAGNPKVKLAHVVDVKGALAESIGKKHGVPYSTRLADALGDPNVQGVVLCTPHTQHCEQIQAVARAKKHVFCEKPLCMSRDEVLRATQAVNEAGVKLAVGHEMRFSPPIQEMMRMLQAGEIGTPLQFEANFSQDKFLSLTADNWRLSTKEAPAGPMTATGVHLLDLSVGIFGQADWVRASVKQLGSQLTNGDTLAILVSFKSGGHALISGILATPFYGRFALFGSTGWIEIREKAHPESPKGWTLTLCKRGADPVTTDYPVALTVVRNLEAFADACAGRAPYPVPQEQMIANVSALEAVFKSALNNRVEQVVNS
jgi:predicted dehydrogenase